MSLLLGLMFAKAIKFSAIVAIKRKEVSSNVNDTSFLYPNDGFLTHQLRNDIFQYLSLPGN
jgi:hypothetical protein